MRCFMVPPRTRYNWSSPVKWVYWVTSYLGTALFCSSVLHKQKHTFVGCIYKFTVSKKMLVSDKINVSRAKKIGWWTSWVSESLTPCTITAFSRFGHVKTTTLSTSSWKCGNPKIWVPPKKGLILGYCNALWFEVVGCWWQDLQKGAPSYNSVRNPI